MHATSSDSEAPGDPEREPTDFGSADVDQPCDRVSMNPYMVHPFPVSTSDGRAVLADDHPKMIASADNEFPHRPKSGRLPEALRKLLAAGRFSGRRR